MKWQEILVNAILPFFGNLGKEQLIELLDKLREQNPDGYKAFVVGIYPPFKLLLEPLVAGTKTRIDDTIVGVIISTLEESAAKTGTTLPDVTPASHP